MIIGVDFDNTLVNYDNLFYKAALEENIIPKSLEKTKNGVRDYLRKAGKEDLFTRLQGVIYGPKIIDAESYPGVKDFFKMCKDNNIKIYIISHKTLYPIIGERYNLHDYAREWITKNGFFDKSIIGMDAKDVFFELTKKEKIERIKNLKCTHFIDDLPEFLNEKDFPRNVCKILFDPDKKHENISSVLRVSSWSNMPKELGLNQLYKFKERNAEYFKSEEFYHKVKHMILSFEEGVYNKTNLIKNTQRNEKKAINNLTEEEPFDIIPLNGGKNNRVFIIKVDEKRKYLLKSYFYHPNDSRDRLKHEFLFLKFAWENGIRCIPQPLAADFKEKLGLYEFIEGQKIKDNLNKDNIRQAVDFIIQINKFRDIKSAKEVPIASDACLSINDHINSVKRRIDRLKKIDTSSEINKKALDFVNKIILREFESLLYSIHKEAKINDISLTENITNDCLCISPSDFGYHNALINDNGKIFFLDFEYAGFDDPAKMVCDFFSQPDLKVSMKYYDQFVKNIYLVIYGKNAKKEVKRTKMIFPLYKLKWCGIMLNEFLDVEKARRMFANLNNDSDYNHDKEKEKQLIKAQNYLRS